MTGFYGVPSNQLGLVMDQVLPMLELTIEQYADRYTVESVIDGLMRRDMQLWVSTDRTGTVDGFCVTDIISDPKGNICRVVFGGGSYSENWKGYLLTIEQWAVDNGCDGTEVVGRKGWVRRFRELGYEPAYVVIRKEFI